MYLFSISVGTAVILKRNENSLCKIWWGVEGGGANKVHYGKRGSGVWRKYHG